MKTITFTLTLLLLIAGIAGAQTLAAQYDMVSITGGTTLTDLSGNAKHGTIVSATTTLFGLKFNGTSDYMTLPTSLNGLAAFTVIACGSGSTGGGLMWSEIGAGNNLLGIAHQFSAWARDGSRGSSIAASWSGLRSGDYHCTYLYVRSRLARFGYLDGGLATDLDLGSQPFAPVTTGGAIGGRNLGASRDMLWGGTVAWLEIWNGGLNLPQLNDRYAAIRTSLKTRNIILPDAPTFSKGVWRRQGTIFSGAYDQPNVLYEGAGVWKMWLTSTGSNAILYSTSTDGYTWSTPTTVITSLLRNTIVKVGSTYYTYGQKSDNSAIQGYTSTNGTTWTLVANPAIAKGTAGQFDSTGVFHPAIWYEGGTFYMIYEATGVDPSGASYTGFSCGAATSSDGITWTKASANPISGYNTGGISCSANQIQHINGIWYLWAHDAATHIYRRTAAAFTDFWKLSPATATLTSGPVDEGSQVSNINFVQVGNQTYMYYLGSDANFTGSIKFAIADMTLNQLVLTDETSGYNFP